ncbi:MULTISPECIES: hypothetical protein [Burkholderia]|uniref:hypothetical protein n=1 Tax=Burkholderia TaxID=32008 RepID=UPI0011A41503|nr:MULTISPECIES: hypothetical protein [Burkholderia]MBU9382376.1 hypothetical protein [Burkholderia gladioli]MDN7738100.1 hypothetical protein [Burkholderia gladioli]
MQHRNGLQRRARGAIAPGRGCPLSKPKLTSRFEKKLPESGTPIVFTWPAIHPTNSQNVTIAFLPVDLYFPTIHTKRIKWQTFAETQHFCQVASRTTILRGA